MEPIKFNGITHFVASNQEEYLTLPAHISRDGITTSCWRLTFRERLKLLFTGKMYAQTMTFGKPLQPQKLVIENPVAGEK